MQNNENHPNFKRVRNFFAEKGYYIVLFLCVCAVGISGYLFVSHAVSEKRSMNEATLSVAQSAADPAKPEKRTQQADPTPTTAEQSDSAPVSAMTDEDVREKAQAVRTWPISGPTLAPYSVDALVYNATTQDWRTHAGIDLAAEVGTPVAAAGSGTVTAVYDDEYLGTTVVITHPDERVSQYSNLAAMPAVSAGDTVEAGQIIGSVGTTALLEIAEQPHLHFAVFADGEPIDPTDFIG